MAEAVVEGSVEENESKILMMNKPKKGMVTKTKSVTKGDVKVTKSTTKGAGVGKKRSVVTEKPGGVSTKTNMGPVKQARVFRREIKKNK